MPTVALITSQYALTSPVDADREIGLIADELARRGVTCLAIDWLDTSADYAACDLVVIKSPWDYASRHDHFLDWLARVEAVARVVNPPEVIRWNMDKRYLGELTARGVRACPTSYCHTPDEVRQGLAIASGHVVIKPNVSAASADTGMFEPDDPGALTLAEHILAAGKLVMIQPAIASVAQVGERSLIYFGDRFVHAIRKGPLLALGGGLHGDEYQESILPDQAATDEREFARQALDTVERIFTDRGLAQVYPLLYARVDIARDARDRPVLMELELFEPSYFLDLAPGAETLFVDCLMARLAS